MWPLFLLVYCVFKASFCSLLNINFRGGSPSLMIHHHLPIRKAILESQFLLLLSGFAVQEQRLVRDALRTNFVGKAFSLKLFQHKSPMGANSTFEIVLPFFHQMMQSWLMMVFPCQDSCQMSKIKQSRQADLHTLRVKSKTQAITKQLGSEWIHRPF